jgi:hypothetical protein
LATTDVTGSPHLGSRPELRVNEEREGRLMRQAGAVKIELKLNAEVVTLAVDGRPLGPHPRLSWVDGLGRRHPLVWLRGERMYDVELWVGDTFVGYVPGRNGDVEADYEDAERRTA